MSASLFRKQRFISEQVYKVQADWLSPHRYSMCSCARMPHVRRCLPFKQAKCIAHGGYRLNVRSCTPLRHPTSSDHAADSCRGIPENWHPTWPTSNVSSCAYAYGVTRRITVANENRVERVNSAANQVALALLSSGSCFVQVVCP